MAHKKTSKPTITRKKDRFGVTVELTAVYDPEPPKGDSRYAKRGRAKLFK